MWREAPARVLAVYRLSEQFPKHELFGLASQSGRAAVPVAANFAEGFKKRGQSDKLRFYNMAQGSLGGCRYFILARDLNYADPRQLIKDSEETGKMLDSYMHSVLQRP